MPSTPSWCWRSSRRSAGDLEDRPAPRPSFRNGPRRAGWHCSPSERAALVLLAAAVALTLHVAAVGLATSGAGLDLQLGRLVRARVEARPHARALLQLIQAGG